MVNNMKKIVKSITKTAMLYSLSALLSLTSVSSILSGCGKPAIPKHRYEPEELIKTFAWNVKTNEVYEVSKEEAETIPSRSTPYEQSVFNSQEGMHESRKSISISPDGKYKLEEYKGSLSEKSYWKLNGKRIEITGKDLKLTEKPDSVEESLDDLINCFAHKDWSPVWSADSKKIVFAHARSHCQFKTANYQNDIFACICSFDVDTEKVTKLIECPRINEYSDIDLSRDERYVAYGGKDCIFVADLEKSTKTNITKSSHPPYGHASDPNGFSGVTDQNPRFSPDGKYVVYYSERYSNKDGKWVYDIFRINADGTNNMRLTSNNISFSPELSPDGKKIAYISGANIGIMDNDGENKLRLIQKMTGVATELVWSRDGKKLFYAYDIGPYVNKPKEKENKDLGEKNYIIELYEDDVEERAKNLIEKLEKSYRTRKLFCRTTVKADISDWIDSRISVQ